jgi:hypothetical protein
MIRSFGLLRSIAKNEGGSDGGGLKSSLAAHHVDLELSLSFWNRVNFPVRLWE